MSSSQPACGSETLKGNFPPIAARLSKNMGLFHCPSKSLPYLVCERWLQSQVRGFYMGMQWLRGPGVGGIHPPLLHTGGFPNNGETVCFSHLQQRERERWEWKGVLGPARCCCHASCWAWSPGPHGRQSKLLTSRLVLLGDSQLIRARAALVLIWGGERKSVPTVRTQTRLRTDGWLRAQRCFWGCLHS